jgi:diguanylate cyclase (GGDEF)-like protein
MAKERLELRQRNEALTDPLTGLPNRRAFFRQALRRMRPQHGAAGPVAVLLFDLDQFKSINDRYGHGYGDQVLVLFAEILSSRLKATDVIGRVGGEEFAVLLPGTDLASAAIAAERVRAAYEDSAAVIDGNAIRATVSVGVAATEAADCSLHELLGHADSALYSAKAAGRNCIRLVDARSKNRTDGPALPGRVAVPA